MADFDADLAHDDTDWEVDIDLEVLIDALLTSPKFVKSLAILIRNAQTKDSRRMQNLYGTTAQRPSPKPATKGRLS